MRFRFFNNPAFRFWRTALVLVLIPVLDTAFLLWFFGPLLTMLTMLVGGLLGAFLAYRQGVRCWLELNQQLNHGETPVMSVLNCFLILLAVLLLLLPGLLTCLIGLVLLIPLARSIVVSYMVLNFEAHRLRTRQRETPSSPDIIDV